MKKYSLKRLLAVMLATAMVAPSIGSVNVSAMDSDIVVTEDSFATEDMTDLDSEVITTVSAGQEEAIETAEPTVLGEGDQPQIEINQGFSMHYSDIRKNSATYMNDFVAKKQTVIMMKIPGSDADGFGKDKAEETVKNYKFFAKAVTNGEEASNNELSADGDSFTVKAAFDDDNDQTKGYYAVLNFPEGPDKGTYNLYVQDNNGQEISSNKGVNFFETQTLNILIVPVKTYWGEPSKDDFPADAKPESWNTAYGCMDAEYYGIDGSKQKWDSLANDLKEYLLDVYPVANINFETAQELDASDSSYNMITSDGQKKLWEEACKLQVKDKESGKDKYDLILAFVKYRQDNGGGQGFTYGKPTNIITYLDKDMLPTVAHEIAHCYKVGDEYKNGSLYLGDDTTAANLAPNGYTGRNYATGDENITVNLDEESQKNWYAAESKKKDKVTIDEGFADGSVVSLGLHPFSLKYKEFITWANGSDNKKSPTVSYMGSGYKGNYEVSDGHVGAYYFTTTAIWDHLFKSLLVKEKKEESTDNSENKEDSNQGEESSGTKTNADVYEASVLYAESEPSVSANGFFNEDDFYYDDDVHFGEARLLEVSGWLVREGGTDTVEMDPMFSYQGDLEYLETEDIKDDKNLFSFVALSDKEQGTVASVDDEDGDAVLAVTEFDGNTFLPSNVKLAEQGFNEKAFSFEALYPEESVDLVIVKGKVKDGKIDKSKIVWSAVDNDKLDLSKNVVGELTYADVNGKDVTLEYDLYVETPNEEGDMIGEEYDKNKHGDLYTEVFYYPEGDDGEGFFIMDSEDDDWEDGYISFDLDGLPYTKNAYVWVKVTDGVNACDIFSDELDVTVTNSEITLSGVKSETKDCNKIYYALYTGAAICPSANVKAYNPETGKYISLVKDQDYKVSYVNNVKKGTAKVIVEGIGAYAGKNTKEFEIRAMDIKNGKPEEIPDMKYDSKIGEEVIKHLSIVDSKNNRLVYGTDFTVKYSVDGNKNSDISKVLPKTSDEDVEVEVTFAGKGNYAGDVKKTIKFKVIYSEANLISNCTIKFKKTDNKKNEVTDYAYTGNAIKPGIVVTISENGLTKNLAGKYYKVLYTSNTDIGTGKVVIVGKNGYVGTLSRTFTISPKIVSSLSIQGVKNMPYTGVSINGLPIVVKAGGTVLRENIDYRVTVSGNTVDVTNNDIKKAGNQPKVVVTLITPEEAKGKKSSLQPKVKWKLNSKTGLPVKNCEEKKFSVVSAKLNSDVTTQVTLKDAKNISANVVYDRKDGKTTGISINGISMNKAPNVKDEKTGKVKSKGYSFVITGPQEYLYSTADVKDAIVVSSMGAKIDIKDVNKFKVEVSKTKSGKVGKITIKYLGKDKKYSGNKVIKFMYEQNDVETSK